MVGSPPPAVKRRGAWEYYKDNFGKRTSRTLIQGSAARSRSSVEVASYIRCIK